MKTMIDKVAPFAVVLSPGLHDAGPGSWLSIWQDAAGRAGHHWHRVVQSDWDDPDPDQWTEALAATVEEAGNASPALLIGHSLGALTIARAALSGVLGPVAGAFLVAPPDTGQHLTVEEIARWGEGPWGTLPFPSALVASRDDPWCGYAHAATLARSWGARLMDADAAGHITAEDGHGPWPEGQDMLRDFATVLNGPMQGLSPGSAEV